eukprot:m.52088 g.52088  ORF g.52088 m.52088 type:complete len:91 (+) comp34182_c0_seq1:1189-1461(+)
MRNRKTKLEWHTSYFASLALGTMLLHYGRIHQEMILGSDEKNDVTFLGLDVCRETVQLWVDDGIIWDDVRVFVVDWKMFLLSFPVVGRDS